ncbi:putative transcriptional factor b3 [Erysiphe necator]|uniref:Putative transcriptional factor b3 n=1 Tax=Uncinula necator TaxID=52586 RepID=A0A0B1P5L7_UNCNE|nr:putative transcriptional factor b3 [Erysiphe necator]
MPVAHPSQGEYFYLRLLLTVKRGARSYQDLYAVNGIEHVSPSAACRAMGLLADEREWVKFIDRIKDTATGHSSRMSLASIITNSLVTSAQSIWDQFKEYLTDDCLHRLSLNKDNINPPPSNWTEEQYGYDYGLWLLGDILRDLNRDWVSAYMSGPDHTWVNRESEPNLLVLDALNFDRVEEERHFNLALTSFSPGQRSAFDKIVSTIDTNSRPNTFFLQGPAGTGKPFFIKLYVISIVRKEKWFFVQRRRVSPCYCCRKDVLLTHYSIFRSIAMRRLNVRLLATVIWRVSFEGLI